MIAVNPLFIQKKISVMMMKLQSLARILILWITFYLLI